MTAILAYADSTDAGSTGLQTVLICVAIAAAAGFAALLPIVWARSRRHRQADAIVALAVLWAVLSAWSVVATTLTRVNYSREKLQNLETGYDDPTDNSSAPAWPARTWIALGAGYAGLVLWSSRRP